MLVCCDFRHYLIIHEQKCWYKVTLMLKSLTYAKCCEKDESLAVY